MFPLRMTAITTQAVIHVIADSPVFRIHCGLVMRVAGCAAEDRIIGGVRVTIGASIPLPGV
jgi:hypothetical protein